MTIKVVTRLNSHDVILVLFFWIFKQDSKKNYLVTGDWSQASLKAVPLLQFFFVRTPLVPYTAFFSHYL